MIDVTWARMVAIDPLPSVIVLTDVAFAPTAPYPKNVLLHPVVLLLKVNFYYYIHTYTYIYICIYM